MSIEMISVKCPECGASMNIESDRKTAFCSYCGARILLHDSNEYTVSIHDDASVKAAETDQIVQIRKMEMLEKARAAKAKRHSFKIRLCVFLGIVGVVSFFIGLSLGDNGGFPLTMIGYCALIALMLVGLSFLDKGDDLDVDFGDMAKVPSGINGYWQRDYMYIEDIFRSAGFTNITSVGLGDIKVGLFSKPGKVESITVNGERVTTDGKKFPKDARVIISYHS